MALRDVHSVARLTGLSRCHNRQISAGLGGGDPEVDPAARGWAIRKALEKLPDDRFKTIRDFARALTDPSFRHGELVGVSAPTSRRWPLGALALAVSVVALALLSTWLLTRTNAPAPTFRASIVLAEPQSGNLGTMGLSRDGSILVYEGPSEEGCHRTGAGWPTSLTRRDETRSTCGLSRTSTRQSGLCR